MKYFEPYGKEWKIDERKRKENFNILLNLLIWMIQENFEFIVKGT